MDMLQLPAFGEDRFFDDLVGANSRVLLIPETDNQVFERYASLFAESGFETWERSSTETRCFAVFRKNSIGIFLSYYRAPRQLQMVIEENCNYFTYSDRSQEATVTPRLSQLFLCDYGMSYVLRLSDGRLVIIDGANVYEKDIDNLFDRLKTDSPADKPVIAAWIFTHPHSDHYFCFFPFMEKYGDRVEIQKFFFHFPDSEDLGHFPALGKTEKVFSRYSGEDGITSSRILRRFYEKVAQLGVPVYTPHAGQHYKLGDAMVQFFSAMDDTVHRSQNINASSLMFTIDIAGQRIFFGGDGSFDDSLLAQRFGNELKSDILQFPHHGFGCGAVDGQISALRLIAPSVCVLPVEKDLAYRTFTTYREGTNYMMTRLGIKELRTGEAEHTLELPYHPNPDGVLALQQNYQRGRDDAGARAWIFSDLNAGKPEDFWFSVLNTTYLPANITAELYFENMEKKILRVSFPGPRLGVYRLHCLLPIREGLTEADIPAFLNQRDIPQNTPFAVRFLSDLPIVISHKEHAPSYRSSVI